MSETATEVTAGYLMQTLETILVVDDTDIVLNLVVTILEAANFHVLRANSGPDAVKLAANYSGKIDLLLSDVQMPEMSGPQLGDALKQARPDIRVMFMSGFSRGRPSRAQLRMGLHRQAVRAKTAGGDGEYCSSFTQ